MTKYIKGHNLPPRFNILAPLCWLLVLERFDAPGWAYGVVGCLFVIAWAVDAVRQFTWDAVDLFDK
jgi:hypothetical protein